MTTARTAACVLAVWVLVAAGLSDLGSAHAPQPAASRSGSSTTSRSPCSGSAPYAPPPATAAPATAAAGTCYVPPPLP